MTTQTNFEKFNYYRQIYKLAFKDFSNEVTQFVKDDAFATMSSNIKMSMVLACCNVRKQALHLYDVAKRYVGTSLEDEINCLADRLNIIALGMAKYLQRCKFAHVWYKNDDERNEYCATLM